MGTSTPSSGYVYYVPHTPFGKFSSLLILRSCWSSCPGDDSCLPCKCPAAVRSGNVADADAPLYSMDVPTAAGEIGLDRLAGKAGAPRTTSHQEISPWERSSQRRREGGGTKEPRPKRSGSGRAMPNHKHKARLIAQTLAGASQNSAETSQIEMHASPRLEVR